MAKFTKDEINEAALRDYRSVAGKVVWVTQVECYDDNDNQAIVTCDPPALARIQAYEEREELENIPRWTNEEFCDPYYNLEILEKHPAFTGLRPSWTFGTCRSVNGEINPAPFALAPPEVQEEYKDVAGLPYETGAAAPEGAVPNYQPFG